MSETLVRLDPGWVHPIGESTGDYDPLMEMVGDARIVLLGEASHGTHEFYHERARITRRLIEEKGFTIVALEADWPDAYRVNRFVRGMSDDADSLAALADFHRFPLWMWRNTETVDLINWLRDYNRAVRSRKQCVGFYGLDLYSMYASIDAVIGYLQTADPEGAERARQRYGCFEEFGRDSQAYGYASSLGLSRTCEEEALQQLLDLRRSAEELARRNGRIPEDEYFYAEQNARLVKNAEAYYRSMFQGRTPSWNLRDSHMTDTLQALVEHLGQPGVPARAVVWAHNSHLGDARATEMGASGEWNLGQLTRERYGEEVCSVGFSTYTGTVTAATDWGEPAERRWLRPGLPGSFEDLMHAVGRSAFFLPLGGPDVTEALRKPRLERAVGVIYRPQTERESHYFRAHLPAQFDALIHIDETSALQPLERSAAWEAGETPDTYPFEV